MAARRTIALLLAPAAIILWCGWQRRWTADDGFINLRVVRQLLEGHGPVFNAGQRVETGTSPAWIAVLAFLDLVTPVRLEWIAALTGLLSTVGAMVVAVFGTRRALLAAGTTGLLLPLGALAYVSLPPAWDFATSGLETGLALLWLAVAWSLLCGASLAVGARPPWYLAVVLGLGPLVRPDFLVFTAGFVVALVVLSGRREVWRIVMLAAVVPVITELARMAYFASLVPNTALAKEASLSNWSQGWEYVVDFVGAYVLVLPLAALAGIWWVQVRNRRGDTATRRFVWLSTIVAGSAVVQALYVVRVGGDFMHGRLLLPAWFVVLLPVSVVVARGWARVVAGGVAVWAVAAMFVLRPGVLGCGDPTGPERRLPGARRPHRDRRRAPLLHPPVVGAEPGDDRRLPPTRPVGATGADTRRLAARERASRADPGGDGRTPIVVPLRRGSAPRTGRQ